MSPRPLALLTGLYLLATLPAARGQNFYPPELQVRQPAPGTPQLPPEPPPPDILSSAMVPDRVPSPWYAAGETAVLFNSAVHFDGHFASVEGDKAVYVSPRVYVGRELANGGSVRFTYRNLTEVGHTGSLDYGDWAPDRTFTTNWFDLDYVSREFAPRDWWRLRWELGGRFVFRYAALKEQSDFATYNSSQNYFGGGPHFGLSSWWLLGQSGWAVYGRADTAVTFGCGQATYRYQPRETRPDPWGWVDSPSSSRTTLSECQFDLGLQLALVRRWEWRGRTIGVGAGFQLDVLSVGNLDGPFHSFGLVNLGPFLRGEVGF